MMMRQLTSKPNFSVSKTYAMLSWVSKTTKTSPTVDVAQLRRAPSVLVSVIAAFVQS